MRTMPTGSTMIAQMAARRDVANESIAIISGARSRLPHSTMVPHSAPVNPRKALPERPTTRRGGGRGEGKNDQTLKFLSR